jgi:hypothetical protein
MENVDTMGSFIICTHPQISSGRSNVAHTRQERKVYRVSAGKPKGKRPFERPRRKWKDELEMDLK